jgi:hypothetical protein
MNKLIILVIAMVALTGCPKQDEIKDMVSDLRERKSKAEELIKVGDFSTQNLLLIQEYFFDFSEKVHLLTVEDKAIENVSKMAKKAGLKQFCSDFFISKESWVALNQFCDRGDYYACSFEMKEFPAIAEKLKGALGSNFEKSSKNIEECFN